MKKRIIKLSLIVILAAAQIVSRGVLYIPANAASVNSDDYETDFSDLKGWIKDGGEVTPRGKECMEIYADSKNSSNRYSKINFYTDVTKNFEYECRVKVNKFSSEAGTKIEFGTHRLLLAFKSDSVYCQTKTGAITLPYDLKDRWVTVKAVVRVPNVTLYVDGEYATEYELQSYSMANSYMQFWVRHNVGDTVSMSVDYAKLTLYKFWPEITGVENGQQLAFGETVTVGADIVGTSADVQEVKFYSNSDCVGTDLSSPFEVNLTGLAPGDYEIFAEAHGTNGKVSVSDAVKFSVKSSISVQLSSNMEGYDLPFGDMIRYTATVEDLNSDILGVEFYSDGKIISSKHEAPYTVSVNNLEIGEHNIYAVVYNKAGQREKSNVVRTTVVGKADWKNSRYISGIDKERTSRVVLNDGDTVKNESFVIPFAYNYKLDFYKQGGALKVILGNGMYLADIIIYDDKIEYKTDDGYVSCNTSVSDNTSIGIVSVGEYADVYLNGEIKFSYVMPKTGEKTMTYSYDGGGSATLYNAEIKLPFGYTEILSCDEINLASGEEKVFEPKISNNEYEFITIADFSKGLSFDLSDGAYEIRLNINNGNIKAYASKSDLDEAKICDVGETAESGCHGLRIAVSKGLCQVFIDGKFVTSFRTPKKLSKPQFKLSSDSETVMKNIKVFSRNSFYIYEQSFDNISDEQINKIFTTKTGEWRLEDGRFLSPSDAESEALVYTHSLNLRFEAKVKAERLSSNSKIYFVSRYNTDEYNVCAGYNNETGRWEIVENNGGKRVVAKSNVQSFVAGKEYLVELVFEDKSLMMFVDGKLMLSTDDLSLLNFGKIGFKTEACAAKFDELFYEGNAQIMKDTFETELKCKHSTDLLKYDGVMYAISLDGTMVRSFDNGLTWGERENEGMLDGNVLCLKNGTIVSVKNRNPNPNADGTYMDRAYVSKDGMKTWEGPFDVESEWKTRDTMNGKITELTDGRVIFCAGDADILSSGDVEDTGGLRVYYSDDSGRSWKGSSTPVVYSEVLVNVQEGKVVELSDGSLKLYCRTDRGYLYQMNSYDRGETWDLELKPTQLISTLCAFNVERDPETGYHYVAWTYENTNDRNKIQHPRQRLGFAVSKDDMKTFEYITQIDDWRGNTDRFMNASIDITDDYIYVNVARLYGSSNTDWRTMLYRISKKDIVSSPYFERPYIDGKISFDEEKSLKNIVGKQTAFLSGKTQYLSNEKVFDTDFAYKGIAAFEKDGCMYLPFRTVAAVLNAEIRFENDLMSIVYLGKKISLKKDLKTVWVDNESSSMKACPIEFDSRLYVPANELFEKIGKSVYYEDGLMVVSNENINIDNGAKNDICEYLSTLLK